jgi:hypothetical protein
MSQYNPSIYEAPRIGPRAVRGEEGEDVTVIDYWSPALADSFRSPTGLYDKYVAALVQKYMELESAYGEEAKQWYERQPMSYWLGETAKSYRRWGFGFFGAESKRPLLPKYKAIPKYVCLKCQSQLTDPDNRAVQDYWEVEKNVTLCRKCVVEAMRNFLLHYRNPATRPRWTFIRKGSLGTEFRASKWEESWHLRER